MATTRVIRIIAGTFALCLASCAASSTSPGLVIDRSIQTFDGLHPAESPIFEQAFVRDPLDLSVYDALMIESSPLNYRHEDSQPGDDMVILTPEQRDRFEVLISKYIGESLRNSTQFHVADRPDTDVLTLWGT